MKTCFEEFLNFVYTYLLKKIGTVGKIGTRKLLGYIYTIIHKMLREMSKNIYVFYKENGALNIHLQNYNYTYKSFKL